MIPLKSKRISPPRKIYQETHPEIELTSSDRIYHLDGNPNNNDPENLYKVSSRVSIIIARRGGLTGDISLNKIIIKNAEITEALLSLKSTKKMSLYKTGQRLQNSKKYKSKEEVKKILSQKHKEYYQKNKERLRQQRRDYYHRVEKARLSGLSRDLSGDKKDP